jgi:hypothetical protein
MKQLLLFFLLAGGPQGAWSQSTIAYTGGPTFSLASYAQVRLDLNHDGTADLGFGDGSSLCTLDIPISLCTSSFYVTAFGTNAVLTRDQLPLILSAGEWIGPRTHSNSVWSTGGNGSLLTWWWSERLGTSGASGPLAGSGEGYLGAQFFAADGLHHAWVHVRDTAVLDWAYETRPGVPIGAGARPVPVPLASPVVVRPGYLRLQWASEIGKAYQVQTKNGLEAFPWTNLSWIIPATASNTIVDLPIRESAQFFRVVEAD